MPSQKVNTSYTKTTFQALIFDLQNFWSKQGCVVLQPYDMEMGAGTFHPATFLRSIGPEPWFAAYIQPSRRPTDGRYGENPNRTQQYFQFQVVMKPNPPDIVDRFLYSLEALGIDRTIHDVRLVEDNWESPTLGAWGLGWEIWLNGMEIAQFTYFQQAGGLECQPVTGEITYGVERIAMYLQNVDSLFDLEWGISGEKKITYSDIFLQNEKEMSQFNFELANTEFLFASFKESEKRCNTLIENKLSIPAYEQVLKTSHTFNLLDARQAFGVTERQRFILRVRELARKTALVYLESREELGFPLIDHVQEEASPNGLL